MGDLIPIAATIGVVVFVFLLGFLIGVTVNLDRITDEYEEALKSHERLTQTCMDTMDDYKKTIEMYLVILRSGTGKNG